jgi:hypothetical protein
VTVGNNLKVNSYRQASSTLARPPTA